MSTATKLGMVMTDNDELPLIKLYLILQAVGLMRSHDKLNVISPLSLYQ